MDNCVFTAGNLIAIVQQKDSQISSVVEEYPIPRIGMPAGANGQDFDLARTADSLLSLSKL